MSLNFQKDSVKPSLLVFIFVLSLFLWFVYHISSYQFVDNKFEVNLSMAKNALTHIDDKVDLDFETRFFIDKVNFPQSEMLKHSSLGKMGFTKNFKLDIKGQIEVSKPGRYIFSVVSDDGFVMTLDDKVAGFFHESRAFKETNMQIDLPAGKYQLGLKYFQGVGPCGLVGKYWLKGSQEVFLFGEDSAKLSWNKL